VKWPFLPKGRSERLRPGLLASSARIALSLGLLSVMLAGEPPAVVRTAMARRPAPAWRSPKPEFRAAPAPPIIVTMTPPAPSPSPPATAMPAPAATATPAHPQATRPPTWIEAPTIGLSAPVVEAGPTDDSLGSVGGGWQVPDGAAGFHKGTAYPGHAGNTVISGHNNMGSEVFRNLVDLAAGDEVILYVDQTPYHYTVTQKELLLEAGASEAARRENARWIAATGDERLTLVTCWPYTGNSHRLIIVAKPR